MRMGTYTFFCRFETEALLPAFKGSTIRGGLGHALKRTVCALRRQECGGCLLSSNCAYAFLFEIETGKAGRRPHPYVLIPPDTEQRAWPKGTPFSFSISLFGKANEYLPHLVYGVGEMGKAGLGKNASTTNGGRFLLDSVQQGDTVIFEGETLKPAVNLAEPSFAAEPSQSSISRINLACLTPLRIKSDNRFQDDLPFHLLVRAALRRVSSLEAAYGNGEPTLDYRGLAARAASVRTLTANCEWQEIERYSNRQKAAMLMGGITGELVYEGNNLGEFLPLLRYCEAVHLGKQTSFGLGRIKVETIA
ncbi:MAG: hypothetical protein A2512_05040 [Deltaproteobacteria bacterium RIFOXYD12_FULL_56_24]|nr:MAG: hypothetical protein A2512_05040 [Deltaproteobacteria bacterium RIFOXYD12_FULL_56_24]